MEFLRKSQQFFMSNFLHSNFTKIRWIWDMLRADRCPNLSGVTAIDDFDLFQKFFDRLRHYRNYRIITWHYPPRKVKNSVFPQLPRFIDFFWEEIFMYYQNKKCFFRFRFSNAQTRVFILFLDKKLHCETVYPPPRKALIFHISIFFKDIF